MEKEEINRRIEVGSQRFEVGGWRMEHLEFKIEEGWLWIEDRHSRFEDFDHSTPTFDTHISDHPSSRITLF